ncbi:hypothetical protein GIS00_12100 [Nakamurella sp. YIM 132087]|uniref:Uncharacterized protein n=1 Tax=Nakamurella alba TaxID=2665158 RepID=A0A7K1FPD7_9ACTN|nr:hypothetical protein [Nakamurella alba]MTD14684.1 hypothetical protein [Nakamurella alba]
MQYARFSIRDVLVLRHSLDFSFTNGKCWQRPACGCTPRAGELVYRVCGHRSDGSKDCSWSEFTAFAEHWQLNGGHA